MFGAGMYASTCSYVPATTRMYEEPSPQSSVSSVKELHGGGAYAKGKGREFAAWLKMHYPSALFMNFERAEGSRQDLTFDGAVPIFVNRKSSSSSYAA